MFTKMWLSVNKLTWPKTRFKSNYPNLFNKLNPNPIQLNSITIKPKIQFKLICGYKKLGLIGYIRNYVYLGLIKWTFWGYRKLGLIKFNQFENRTKINVIQCDSMVKKIKNLKVWVNRHKNSIIGRMSNSS